jgi:hypothetical protein
MCFTFLGVQSIAQTDESNWSAKNLVAAQKGQIDYGGFTGKGVLRPKPGFRLLEISGAFSAKAEPRSLFIDRITLSTRGSKESQRIETIGPAIASGCLHIFVSPFLSKDVSLDFGKDKCLKFSAETSDGSTNLWALCREKDDVMLEVRFSQVSTPACMAFMVPDYWSGNLLLHFGDGTAPVLLPAAK